jgi:hypothetical protein
MQTLNTRPVHPWTYTKRLSDALQFQCDVMQGFAPFAKTAFASKHSMSNAI